jgi:hypothetical protein
MSTTFSARRDVLTLFLDAQAEDFWFIECDRVTFLILRSKDKFI